MGSTDTIESVFDAVMYQKGKPCLDTQCDACAAPSRAALRCTDVVCALSCLLGCMHAPTAAVYAHCCMHALLPRLLAAAGAAVIRMLRAWANRDNRAMPLPTYETVPGATPSEVS